MKKLLEGAYSDMLEAQGGERIEVDALVVEKAGNEGEISFAEFGEAYRSGAVCGIVIPKEYYITHNHVLLQFITEGVDVNDIYDGIRLYEGIEENAEYIAHLITPMLVDPYLPYLEYHVADHCNLNCKYCTHYSPLVSEEVFANPEALKADLLELKKYIKDIGIIRILGGEPLLNPALSIFIEITRQIYPGTVITVVTNGLLLDKMSEELMEAMRINKAFFSISYYPPLEHKISEIKQFLVEHKIPFALSEKIESFNKTQSMEINPDPDFFYHCFQASCTCIHQGKLAPCYAPFTTKYFNDAYDQKLPLNEGIEIYDDDLSLAEIKMRLLVPMERCKYCIDGEACKWEVIGKKSKIQDWI